MSKRFQRNAHKLKELHLASAKTKKRLINSASTDFVRALCDCACNIMNGNVPLTTKHFKQLKKFHKQLKGLTTKSSQKSKKKVLQRGGFLGALLGPIARLLLGGLTK